ncbi:MAG: AMP-binding protein [Thermoanaerobaculia bacterium]|nr:AMP-binding protein [Thermoanaerobaculia bacterium]
MIDWSSDETHLLLNPRLPEKDREALVRLQRSVPALAAHVWIASSGTSGAHKLVALSKRALLASAESVNLHLRANSSDVWLSVLPTFHVGGLGILARAALSGARVVAAHWDARGFVDLVAGERVTLASLVPAQVTDLVAARLVSPSSMRAVVVGGGVLRGGLYREARALGWPLLPSYGLTEAGSQVATADIGGPELRLLPHVECTIVDERIVIRTPALLTGYAVEGEGGGGGRFFDPKVDGWFTTEDRGVLEGNVLEILGRTWEFVKIGGESVDLKRLEAVLEEVRGVADVALVARHDERLGHVLVVAAAGEVGSSVGLFNKRVLPFERIRRIFQVDAIPRTELGKVRSGELTKIIESLE